MMASDWRAPRSCRAFTGYVRGAQGDPGGTVLHCVANSPIPCNAKEKEAAGKGHVSLTIVGIKNVGWAYAPWKKPKANAKSVKDPNAKPLFEQVLCYVYAKVRQRFYFVFTKVRQNFELSFPKLEKVECHMFAKLY